LEALASAKDIYSLGLRENKVCNDNLQSLGESAASIWAEVLFTASFPRMTRFFPEQRVAIHRCPAEYDAISGRSNDSHPWPKPAGHYWQPGAAHKVEGNLPWFANCFDIALMEPRRSMNNKWDCTGMSKTHLQACRLAGCSNGKARSFKYSGQLLPQRLDVVVSMGIDHTSWSLVVRSHTLAVQLRLALFGSPASIPVYVRI
jgi:hypothetical protein